MKVWNVEDTPEGRLVPFSVRLHAYGDASNSSAPDAAVVSEHDFYR